jgi:hypothetical protein
MLFSRAVLVACLTVFRALLWLTGGLLLALTVVQALRGDPDRQPAKTLGLGGGMVAAGFVCRAIARRMEARG